MTATPRKSRTTPVPPRPLKLWQDVSGDQEVRIELVPLIDVIFCILTFFILAAVGFTRQQAINLDLPKASTGEPQMREMLIVSLDDLGQVYIDRNVVTRNQLEQAIENYHQQNPAGMMVLHASRNARYNEVIEILDKLKEVGGDRVSLATLPGAQASDAAPDLNNPNLPPSGTSLPGSSVVPGQGLDNQIPAIPNPPAPPDVPSGENSE